MATYTNFCTRSGGSNLNAGTRTGDTTEPGTSPSFEFTGGTWASATGIFTPTSNPQSAGVAVGDWASIFGSAQSTSFAGASGGIPSGWSTKYTSTNITWTEDAGGYLRGNVSSTTVQRGLSFDTFSPTDGNVEALVKIRTSVSASGTNHFGGVMVRGSGAASSENCYIACIRATSGTAQVGVVKFVTGTSTAVSSATFAWSANTWYWIRFRCIGTSLRVRIWADGGSEPSTWNIDTTDSSIASTSTGYVGAYVGPGVSSGTTDWDSFEVTPLTATRIGRVTAVDSTTVTVSTTVGVGTVADGTSNRTLRIGGAWAGPERTFGFPFNFVTNAMVNTNGDLPRINYKSDQTMSITGNISTINADTTHQGYTSSYGDYGLAILDGGTTGTSYNLIGTTIGANSHLIDFECKNNGNSGSSTGIFWNGVGSVIRCVFRDFRGYGFQSNNMTRVIECEAYGCNQANTSTFGGFGSAGACTFINCISHDNVGSAANGFYTAGSVIFMNCIADTNGGQGFRIEVNGCTLINCDAYNNTGDGIRINLAASNNQFIYNCNLIKNGGYGINIFGAGKTTGVIANCGFGAGTQANTSGPTNAVTYMEEIGSVTYPSNITPYVAPTTGDFRLAIYQAISGGRGIFKQTQASYTGSVSYPPIGANYPKNPRLGGRFGGF